MRGHWETTEPLVLAPNQQQQQTIVQEQQHPLHSATTPAWGIADRIVKEEPAEDKNNDSGVSPGHYTSNSASPHSRRSSTANCSLSPGSATSQDSNNMQCGSFDYSPQRIYKSCDSPPEFVRHHPMDDHQSVDQSMDVVSNTMKQSNEDVDFVQDTLQCPICAFTTTNKMKFTEHVTAHCTTKCDAPDFMKAVLGQLSAPGTMQDETDRVSPTQSERFEQESEEAEEPGLRVPRINSQGKVKTFRCKQCNFAAITKLEFWEHSRGHIKAEKLLTCPKCPFVTEYKHHLEYHLRNHIGSKPFKCDKCSYSCVNKSMLNSHLKSHSNVYQYRCANCSYATKYCHSLKLHLRKYAHQPAMVLNADGSPNPLPIIDVYGTRRGPKQKPMKNEDDNVQGMNMVTNNNVQSPLVHNQMTVTPQISPVSHHLDINSVNGVNGIAAMNGLTGTNGMNGMNGMNGVSAVSPNQPTMIPFPYNPLFSGFPLTNRFPVFEEMSEKKMDHVKSNLLMEYAKTMSTQRPQDEFPQDLAVRCFGINGSKFADGFPPANGTTQMAMGSPGAPTATSPIIPNTADAHEEAFESKAAPLDLSKPEVTSNQQEHHRPAVNSPRATGTSRRKGRAVKLARRVMEDETDEDVVMRVDTEESSVRPANDSPVSGCPESKDEEEKGSFASISSELTCQYCEIVFGNDVMYTVHMGYHGYKDPFTCNMCGHQCTDKVSFFLHIARSKHA